MDETTKVKRWAELLQKLRGFFDSLGFTEVMTSCMVPAGAFESSIDPLKVSYSTGEAELHTSPEIEMKRLLAQTKLPIYQICKCFRDDPPTSTHLREFTMLEFYRPDTDYTTLRADMKALLNAMSDRDLSFEEISMRELVIRATGIDFLAVPTSGALRKAIESRSLISLSADDDWDDMFFKLLIEKVEPSLDPDRPTLVFDYPASQAALSKLGLRTGLAERFEIYWRGMELCNGCTELTDIEELKRRFEHECRKRESLGKKAHPAPLRLFDAITGGFPPASGVAVGVDRLFKCLN